MHPIRYYYDDQYCSMQSHAFRCETLSILRINSAMGVDYFFLAFAGCLSQRFTLTSMDSDTATTRRKVSCCIISASSCTCTSYTSPKNGRNTRPRGGRRCGDHLPGPSTLRSVFDINRAKTKRHFFHEPCK